MQCVFLAAGRGARLAPLTDHTPKPLIRVLDVPIIDWIAKILPQSITELIFVVGYRGKQIEEYCGEKYKGRTVRYLYQPQLRGTADALLCAEPYLRGRFLVLPSDDIHEPGAFERLLTHPLALLAAKHPQPERFGVVERNTKGGLDRIIEKPNRSSSCLVSTGAYVLDERIFSHHTSISPQQNEHYLTDMVTSLAQTVHIAIEKENDWIPIGYSADIPHAERELDTRKKYGA